MFSIIIPTLGNRLRELERLFKSLNDQTYKKFEVIIVSQGNYKNVDEILEKYNFDYKHIKINQLGLSNARNIGLKYVTGAIVSFSDDDCWYPSDAFDRIAADFKFSKKGIICYQIKDPIKNELYKKYSGKQEDKVNFRGIFNKSSIEIFLNLNLVNKEDLAFDTEFGLGARFPSGEENIFLCDLYKKGYSICYKPCIVVYHEKRDNKSKLNTSTFIGKGPMFRRMFNLPIALLLLILFFIKKKRHIESNEKMFFKTIRETIKYDNQTNI